jgi:hypothetical protein
MGKPLLIMIHVLLLNLKELLSVFAGLNFIGCLRRFVRVLPAMILSSVLMDRGTPSPKKQVSNN